MYDYLNDIYGKICLEFATQCKTDIGFGAVLLDKEDYIIGRGRNRLATIEDREMIPYVDYAIHAEQAAIMDALKNNFDVVNGSIFVLGMCLSGKNKGKLTVRTEKVFICTKCPHVFKKYNITVYIPHITGWINMTADEAMHTGKQFFRKGYWNNFIYD